MRFGGGLADGGGEVTDDGGVGLYGISVSGDKDGEKRRY